MANRQQDKKEDRLAYYFKPYMDLFVFDELSPAHLEREGLSCFMSGVAVPFRKENLSAFGRGDGLRITDLAENMIYVVGADPDFIYLPEYRKYLNHYFNEKLTEAVISKGMECASKGDLLGGALRFRAALALAGESRDARYGLARACRELYLKEEGSEDRDESYVGRFKAESMELFEELTLKYPDFAPPYYFLGYAYLNMGLYKKAELTWREFLSLSQEEELKEEVRERIEKLCAPVDIEAGCNLVISGKWLAGIQALEPFLETDYQLWWPLSYYLGIAYGKAGLLPQAEERLLHALSLSPSQEDCMEELAEIYQLMGNQEMTEKYRRKLELIRSQNE